MSLNDRVCDALAEYLRERGVDAKSVLSFEEETVYGGGCETCAYEYIVVEIAYEDYEGKSKYYSYDGTFAGLISSL